MINDFLLPQNAIIYFPKKTQELKSTVIHNLIGGYYWDGVVVSGLHHVVQYSPFSAAGAELHNVVKVEVSITSSWTFSNEFHVKQSQTILWYQ